MTLLFIGLGIAFVLLVLWAAPTPTARQTPAGIYLYNGHPTLFTLSLNPAISFWEKEVTPYGFDGGDAIETTNMHNDEWRTMRPRNLKTVTEMTLVALYDPNVMNQLQAMINVEQVGTVTYPDLSTDAVFCYVRTVERDALVEGEPPSMTITIQPTNYDPTGDVEAGPVTASVPGT